MVRIRVQLPNETYLRAKQVADAKGISLAELVRRGLETILQQYPSPEQIRKPWRLPIVDLGSRNLSAEEMKELAQRSPCEEDLERELLERARS